MKLSPRQLRYLIENEILSMSRSTSITESQVRKIIKEEISILLREQDPDKIDATGSIDAVAASIAKDLEREDLKGPLAAAIKKRKGGKAAEDLSTNDKIALSDAFLELIFSKPDAVTKVAAQLKKIVPQTK